MVGWLDGWMFGLLDGWMVGWLDGWMVGLAGWLVGWMVGWLNGGLVGQLDGLFACSLIILITRRGKIIWLPLERLRHFVPSFSLGELEL
jgi:hypothetical protein